MRNSLWGLTLLGLAPLAVPALHHSRAGTARVDTPAPKVIVLEGRRNPADASVSTKALYYLPFDVPPGVTRITIHKELEHGPDTTRKNTVDMGLFDPRGGAPEKNGGHPGAAGFRAWQGGVKEDLVVTGSAATSSPHAIPGPLPAGRWYVAQYYLASAPAGLGYKYTITLSFDGPKPGKATIPKYNPGVVKLGAGWYAGNLHAHSLHSDGGRTFNNLIARNETAGFDFIASTEHNSTTAHYRFAEAARAHPKMLMLFGDELTTPGGHANIIGQEPGHWFDFRIDYGYDKLPALIDDAHRQGAFFVVNHPFAPCTTCTWQYPPAEWAKADAVEVWNGTWTPDDRIAVNMWDQQLKTGRHLIASGGTDYHRGEDAMVPTAIVYADNLSRDAILDGLRKGHIQISESPRGPRLSFALGNRSQNVLPGDTIRLRKTDNILEVAVKVTGGKGNTLRLVWQDGQVRLPVSSDEQTIRYSLPLTTPLASAEGKGYLRAELLSSDNTEQMRALSNPVYWTQ
jgi:hypothetical protein